MEDTAISRNGKAGFLGGTFVSVLHGVSIGGMMETIVYTILGTVVSFCVSFLLKYLVKKYSDKKT